MTVSIDVVALIYSIHRTQASKPLAKALRALANALSKSSARKGYSDSSPKHLWVSRRQTEKIENLKHMHFLFGGGVFKQMCLYILELKKGNLWTLLKTLKRFCWGRNMHITQKRGRVSPKYDCYRYQRQNCDKTSYKATFFEKKVFFCNTNRFWTIV